MITGYCSQKEGNKKYALDTLLLFRDMLVNDSGVNPTDTAMVCVVSAASQLGMHDIGACVHGFVAKTIFTPKDDVFVGKGWRRILDALMLPWTTFLDMCRPEGTGDTSFKKFQLFTTTRSMDPIINFATKSNYMFTGQISVPIVFRGPNDAVARWCQEDGQGRKGKN